ncbi:bifunctional 2-C-methyl-D-erythritol 4-phosphate cytidylyltransferase/2-C-methyl-D-erythritol 2,4-cyclodiphosphate synthase [Parasphingopyxis algicola]|uniref:bifunctional 2-C-methyl-D-erythritol 4-phosphate cytidylyltransferase/2-C-methyl-D-erythritol 2,4-cyclodiphosphate synthase n=1 Tax=Parasphingopyxis algicola TaxID=2026624 RepID=UPI0015A4A3C7|nr:bifunctional 2-C-methyl-D-erythritol 4-phosphate cytidylyltransferase/2-C-methyl-D-erythritol 2,4-cyclodiphosphate synthase [Parasphingopyxis algicola]QLC24174.1 bifunctional 2-C-methyl-D-erythritol 4-phosphate cytidylyltransferase/2-C-methyl-D-erythritol 2,4-cyclodiphosphate synthase [Parasphingopyxis algicola]
MSDRAHIVALIVAAGKGERAGGDTPKQYRDFRGQTVLAHAIDALTSHPAIQDIRVVIGEGQEQAYRQAIGSRDPPPPIIGGASRQESVRNGLEALATSGGADIVLIHDAARPFTPAAVIDRLIDALDADGGAIPALPVIDSLARTDGRTVDRSEFVTIQTPQAFRFDTILSAHRNWTGDRPATDDAAIARAAGHSVALVAGDPALKKITFAEDFAMPSSLSAPSSALIRTGLGYDVHAFTEGDHVWLCGVEIPHDRALAGHSDADVGLHALTDAILGALGEGDIGDHFPPSDPQWKGAASHRFLEHARDLAAERNAAIHHVDVTLICEAPKIGPHRAAMRARIAEILAIPEKSVSVKATTTEKLGFTGRSEGIAAQAIATLGDMGG